MHLGLTEVVRDGAEQLKLSLSDSTLKRLALYADFLQERNRVMNLTAIDDMTGIAQLHFLDSLVLLTCYDFSHKSVIDVGTGAGFPGLPLKVVEETIALTLLDAQQKRVDFLRELTEKLELDAVSAVHSRSEELSLKGDFREKYDVAVSRAVAGLNILCELCLPFVKVGGVFIAMKGTDSDSEIASAENAVKILGATVERITDYTIPGTDIMHRAVIIRKTQNTPDNYPRRFPKIEKKPL